MKNILRSAVLVAAVATAAVMGSVPANAQTAGAFSANIKLDGFGVGQSSGTAELCVTGVLSGVVNANQTVCTSVTGSTGHNATASFTLDEPAGTCPATGTADGTVTGAVSTTFHWTRVGVVALIQTTGGNLDGGVGVAAFAVTSKVGNPCQTPKGTEVDATAVGVLAAP